MSKFVRILIPLLLLGGGYLSFRLLSEKDPKPKRQLPAQIVIEAEAYPLTKSDYRVVLLSQGIVQPHNQTSLTPRVNGRIIEISPKFESGSFFNQGETLLKLDPTDFMAACTAAEARLARAEASLIQEEARAKQALLDWDDLGYTDPPTDLVLRKPQLKEANANVKAATAELSEAQRNLERTNVLAPYAGRVMSRLVGLGQSVGSSTTIGEIFSTDFAEVRLSLSARELTKVILPNNPDDPPVPVSLFNALNDDDSLTWKGSIVRTEGTLDEKSRKLFVIARVDDPFGLKTPTSAPLRIGQPVRAQLEGSLIPDVFVIPRSTLRRPNEILLINPEDSTLVRQRINPVWSDLENLVVTEDLVEGWHLVTNRIQSAPNGAKVKIVTPEPEEAPKAAMNPAKSNRPA